MFRGKRIDNGEWIEGNLLVMDGEEYRIATSCLQGDDDDILMVCAYEVDPDTVGQLAGWNDRHGSNVFDGDVICGFNDLHQRQETYLVKWACNNGFYLIDNCGVDWHPEHVENQEIIGNIHDHPSLLQG